MTDAGHGTQTGRCRHCDSWGYIVCPRCEAEVTARREMTIDERVARVMLITDEPPAAKPAPAAAVSAVERLRDVARHVDGLGYEALDRGALGVALAYFHAAAALAAQLDVIELDERGASQ